MWVGEWMGRWVAVCDVSNCVWKCAGCGRSEGDADALFLYAWTGGAKGLRAREYGEVYMGGEMRVFSQGCDADVAGEDQHSQGQCARLRFVITQLLDHITCVATVGLSLLPGSFPCACCCNSPSTSFNMTFCPHPNLSSFFSSPSPSHHPTFIQLFPLPP